MRTRVLALLLASACHSAPQAAADAEAEVEADGGLPMKPDEPIDRDGGVPPNPSVDAGRTCARDEGSAFLVFDGVDDGVSMGLAPELGLSTFTVEAWVRRDGLGRDMGTGVGGLRLIPIAGKGRGENDGSNVDCNYAFGFFGDVLGADFEDSASGANHPITGRTAIPIGEWHHVAVTYDGALWRLFVDGRIDAESRANATPRFDSIQHFGIATSFDSMGRAAGRFHGAIDELRVWNRARTEEEVAASRFATIAMADGLVGRWAIEFTDEGVAIDSTGMNHGMIAGAKFRAPGAVLDRGLPPTITPATSLELRIEDEDSDVFEVTFYSRSITDADDFTIVVLPDTQYYTVEGNNLERYFYDQTQWIVDNAAAYNIVAVIHNGDIVDRANQNYQWTIADRAMDTLDAAEMPYGVAVGNHDEDPNSSPSGTAQYNQWFGVQRFQGRPYYGGHYGDNNDESWYTFSAGGHDFVVVNMKFNANPDQAVLTWARRVFESHPESFGILNAHYILGGSGSFGPQGQKIYDALRGVQNVHLLTCGHVSNERRRTDTYQGHSITSMLADYQGRANGGGGVMRIWEFSPANGELTVRSYSPTADTWETDDNSEFTLPVDIAGSGGPFSQGETLLLDRNGTMSATVSLPLAGIERGEIIEWYATVSDCNHTVSSPVQRFTQP